MPKRQRKPDPRWERTDGGLVAPRRCLTLPTRRWVQRMGSANNCCDDPCAVTYTRIDTLGVVISGATDGANACEWVNDDWELDVFTAAYTDGSGGCWKYWMWPTPYVNGEEYVQVGIFVGASYRFIGVQRGNGDSSTNWDNFSYGYLEYDTDPFPAGEYELAFDDSVCGLYNPCRDCTNDGTAYVTIP